MNGAVDTAFNRCLIIFGVTTYNQPLQYDGYITSQGHSSGTVFLVRKKIDVNIPLFALIEA